MKHLIQAAAVALMLVPIGGLAIAQELLLFGGRGHDEFLGCLNCSRYDSGSICNEYGKGSKYDSKSIFNEYGTFGSKYSSSSPWNKYSSGNSVPVLVDRGGSFYGYFTINKYRGDAVNFASDLGALFDDAGGDLEVVRRALCQAFE